MKFLVVYYTRSGKTKVVAEEIAKILNCDIEELVDLKHRQGILGWIISGYDAANRNFTEIQPISKELDVYDSIILCSPIWALNVPPAVRTFLTKFKEKIKNISFVVTMGAVGAKKMFQELKSIVNKEPLFALSINSKEFNTGKYLEKLHQTIQEFSKLI